MKSPFSSERFPDSESKAGELRSAHESIPSEKHPERNEDVVLADREHGIFAVFDGVGGQAAGETAARLASAVVKENLKADPSSEKEAENAVETAILQANAAVRREGEKEPRLAGMASTASVVKLWRTPAGEPRATVGNVGDSRVYLYREGQLRPLTLDDSMILIDAQTPEKAWERQDRLSRVKGVEDLAELKIGNVQEYHQRSAAIYQALGVERLGIKPRISTAELQPGDWLILTSDGIHDNLTIEEMEATLQANRDSPIALVRAARLRSQESGHLRAKKDDMSALLIETPA